ncbi:MAG: hypothetical protein K2O03_05210, partial [Lachnospiraceae bacterium]|nr:hypothetical protein [Lachnospiraceae bacterium]
MKDSKFDNKVITFVAAISDTYKEESERGAYPKLELTEEGLTEDFTAMLWAQMVLYKRITKEKIDIFDFVAVLNHLAVQRMMEVWRVEETGGEEAAKKDYGHAAARILNALENGRVPI